jgi:hypothetical protein
MSSIAAFGALQAGTAELYNARQAQMQIDWALKLVRSGQDARQVAGATMQPGTPQYQLLQQIMSNISRTEQILVLQQQILQRRIEELKASNEAYKKIAQDGIKDLFGFGLA